MLRQKEFEQFAEQCKRLAADGDVALYRDALQSMAHAWQQLAVEEERIADLVREVDNLFAAPDDTVHIRHDPVWGIKASSYFH